MIRTALLVLLFLCSVCSPRFVYAEARSIMAFVQAEEQWPKTIGTSWRLEGRYALIGDDTLKFMNCKMPFIFGPNIERPPGRFKNLEVSGSIERREGKLVFLMDSCRSMPSDMQQLVLRKSQLDSSDVEEYYKLAEWASSRATFYNDQELRTAAHELRRSGLDIEFRKLEPTDREGLRAIILKARKLNLEKSKVEEFLHDGYWEQFQYLQDRKPATTQDEFASLILSISNDLPGARKPLNEYVADTADHYLAEPFKVFHSATPAERQQYLRYFYLYVTTSTTIERVDPSGKNASKIAASLKIAAPERKELIELYEKMGLQYESQRVNVMTRQEMLELANMYVERDEQKEANEVKKKWLNAREALYKEDGARGLVDLAEEWIQLLDDRQTAAKYYIEAWKRNSQYPLAAAWLEENGYSLHEGNWIPSELVPPTMESEIDKAIREGRIEKGMTTAQVRAAMGVAPDSLIRLATAGKVTEVWVYESAHTLVRFSWKFGNEAPVVETITSMASGK